ncbi:four helix bundle protein [Algoriphagus sp. AGSA1]|uniref:four helix bundle protein n=1 Tax=Algoriphagus sp. AGSA1 TaxID=2907213 RepID=UPI001F46F8FD|nr:four helix bundle protein [Algoriphagus sp. AGSA1]MCE7057208.1 four helix bundle protein [Algoriphagus sp. AGSA1]
MDFKFEKLRIWQTSMSFGEEVFELSKAFPKEELYSLTSQIRRAVDSIALNIAEGATGNSQAEFRKFIGYSLRSPAEVVTCLHKAKLRGYIEEESFQISHKQAFDLMNSIAAFRNTLVSTAK